MADARKREVVGLDDLRPREQSPEAADRVKGGYDPPDGRKVTSRPLPLDPPGG
jgi:hypothetical protein